MKTKVNTLVEDHLYLLNQYAFPRILYPDAAIDVT